MIYVDCTSKDRVCNSLLITEGRSDNSRIKLCIVNEVYGF